MTQLQISFPALFFILLSFVCKAQDPQNQKVENVKTNCDKISSEFNSLDEAKKILDSATFSFSQEFKTTKSSGVIAANFYTCDNEKGYLWIRVNGKEYIYKDVTHFKWKELIETNDLDGYYEENIKGKFPSAIKNQ